MTHVRLTHPTRQTLEFRQAQADEQQRSAVANVTAEVGVDRPPLVHTETREETRAIRGRVSAPRRSRDDPSTSEWRQALANYVDGLESHVGEFQGTGYTLEDDQLGLSLNAVLESVTWSLDRGEPYDIDFDAVVRIGRGTFEGRAVDFREPTVDASMDTYLRVDGIYLPGMRQYQSERAVGAEVRPVFNRDTAENNDVVMTDGVTQRIAFDGTHTGDRATREADDAALNQLLATREPVTLETKFPGYDLQGFVTGYNSNLESRFGTGRHDYRLEFTYGIRA